MIYFLFLKWFDFYIRNKYEGCLKVKEILDIFEWEKYFDVIMCRMLLDRIN